jgi:hypothetical protein
MTEGVDTIERNDDTYRSLAAKLAELSASLPPDEASALVVLLEHAKEHTTEVTGYEFEAPDEDEVSGFMFNSLMPGAGAQVLNQSIASVGQFGRISGRYRPPIGGQWGPTEGEHF